MNIHAKKGSKVVVTEKTKNSGYSIDAERVAKHLEVGKPYTVDRTDVSGWRTDVYLEEVPGVSFNSVNFEDYDK